MCADGAHPFPFPEGTALPDSLVVHARTMSVRKKGLPENGQNRQSLHKGASVQSDLHQP